MIGFSSSNQRYDIFIALLNFVFLCLLIWTGFSGERCGPWASFFSMIKSILDSIKMKSTNQWIYKQFTTGVVSNDWVSFYRNTYWLMRYSKVMEFLVNIDIPCYIPYRCCMKNGWDRLIQIRICSNCVIYRNILNILILTQAIGYFY